MAGIKTSPYLTLLLMIWGFSTSAGALELYVSPNGSDQNEGTFSHPLASFEKAQKTVRQKLKSGYQEKVNVYFRGGHYDLSRPLHFDQNDSSKLSMITYRAFQNEVPVFSAGRVIENFKKLENGLWQADLSAAFPGNWSFEQLFVNDRRAQKAKFPNNGFLYMHDVHQHILKGSSKGMASSARQYVQINSELLEQLKQLSEEELNNILMTVYHKWDITKRYLRKIYEKNLVVEGKGMKPWNNWSRGQRFILENHLSFLDRPGEWFLSDQQILTYFPHKDETITTSRVMAPVCEDFIIIKGTAEHLVTNLHFEGLRFAHSNHQLDQKGFEPNQAAAMLGAAVHLEYAHGVVFQKCEFRQLGKYAVWIGKGCQNVELQQCLLEDLGAGGVKIGESRIPSRTEDQSQHHKIENCIIRHAGRIYPCAVGIWIGQSSHNKILHNDISDLFYSGISVGWTWNYSSNHSNYNQIAYNHIHHLGYGLLSDMGGVYTLGHSPGTHIHNNILHDIYSYTYGGWGLYTDQGSSHIRFNDNLVYHTKSGGFHQHYGKDNIVENNIFYDQFEHQLKLSRVEEHTSFIFRNNIVVYSTGDLVNDRWLEGKVPSSQNLYWNPQQNPTFAGKTLEEIQKKGSEKGSMIADPNFKNLQNMTFEFSDNLQLQKINFKKFNLNEVGVYGDSKWIHKAHNVNLPSFKTDLDIPSPPAIPIIDDFELDLLNQLPNGIYLSPEQTNCFQVVKRPQGHGQCLKIQDHPNLKTGYHPHLNYRLSNKKQFMNSVSFELFTTPETNLIIELRHYPKSGKYLVGPKLHLDKKKLGSKGLLDLPIQANTWVRYSLDLEKMTLTLLAPDSGKTMHSISFETEDFLHANWFGLTFPGKTSNHVFWDQVEIQVGEIDIK